MEVENTGADEGLGALSPIDKAVKALRDSRAEQPKPEQATEEPEADAEEIQDEQPDPVEVEDVEDHAEEDADEDAEPEDEDSEDDLYQIGDEVFTLSELQEWKKGALRQADYTKKTQELKKDRESFVKERDDFEAQRQQVVDQLTQQQAQLQDTLAMFAVEELKPPKRADFKSTDEYLAAQDSFAEASERKKKAAETYQLLKQYEQQQTSQRETQRALQYFPDWATDEGWTQAQQAMTKAAEPYGFSAEEILQGGLSDHRTFRLLNRLAELEQQVAGQTAQRAAQAKKVAKATKRIAPGSKPSDRPSDVDVQKARKALKANNNDASAAVALLKAKRRANSA